nr:Uncharacterised protein [Providencia rettgeri]
MNISKISIASILIASALLSGCAKESSRSLAVEKKSCDI